MSGKGAICRPGWMTIILDDDYLWAAIRYVERKPGESREGAQSRKLSLAQCRWAQCIETGCTTDEKVILAQGVCKNTTLIGVVGRGRRTDADGSITA